MSAGTPFAKVLLVEDEARVASFITQSLEEHGCEVRLASTLADASEAWDGQRPDVVILDLMLPDGNGLDLLTRYRAAGDSTPVLVLSAKSSLSERVSGLDAGADDYLPKPFGVEELLARIRVLMRRSKDSTPSVVQCADLSIDFISHRVTRSGRVIFLSETEYRLLELLAKQQGKPVAKRDILGQVWDDAARPDNVVEVYVSYLRSKLERAGASRLVQTVRGKGYMLSETEDVP